MDAFQFTNAYASNRLVAVYAQQRRQSKFVDFEELAAGVSQYVWVLAIISCCLLIGLFAVIEHMRLRLERANSPARLVAIIVAGIFVLLYITYNQTLLFSIHEASAAFTLRIE
jgi:hypothetical protein